MCLIPVLKTILFAHKNATSCLIQNSLLPELCLWMVFLGCELAMSSVVIPFSSVLCSGLSDGKMRGYLIWHGDWWSLVVSAATPVNASGSWCPLYGECPKAACPWGCIAELFVGLLTAQFSDIGDLALYLPLLTLPGPPTSWLLCPGLQLGIFTPSSSFLVSTGDTNWSRNSLSLWPLYVSQRLRTPHLSFISLPLLGTLWTENVGASITVSLQLWTVISKKNPRTSYFLFCGAQREGLLVHLARGGRAAAQETQARPNNPWLPQL